MPFFITYLMFLCAAFGSARLALLSSLRRPFNTHFLHPSWKRQRRTCLPVGDLETDLRHSHQALFRVIPSCLTLLGDAEDAATTDARRPYGERQGAVLPPALNSYSTAPRIQSVSQAGERATYLPANGPRISPSDRYDTPLWRSCCREAGQINSTPGVDGCILGAQLSVCRVILSFPGAERLRPDNRRVRNSVGFLRERGLPDVDRAPFSSALAEYRPNARLEYSYTHGMNHDKRGSLPDQWRLGEDHLVITMVATSMHL